MNACQHCGDDKGYSFRLHGAVLDMSGVWGNLPERQAIAAVKQWPTLAYCVNCGRISRLINATDGKWLEYVRETPMHISRSNHRNGARK